MDSIKNVLNNILEGIQEKSKQEPAMLAWEEAVDNQTREHTRPLDMKNKNLRVVVDSSAWMYELSLRKKEIIQKLQDRGLQIESLSFYVGKVH